MIDKGKILFLDLETTGTDPSKHMITQIAAEYHVDGKKVDEFYAKVKAVPQADTAISLEALKVTDQSLKDTIMEGEEESQALITFLDWLLKLDTKKMYICGHNVHFDLGFIKYILRKYRIEKWDSVVSYRVEDTCTIARTLKKLAILDPDTSSSLGNLAKELKVSIPKGEQLHNAATDVKVTAEVYYKLLDMLGK